MADERVDWVALQGEAGTGLFKEAMARYAAGVTVVTTRHEGAPIGITATAFGSVSVEPPLVSVCLGKGLFTNKAVRREGAFGVTVLGADQKEVGLRFAGMLPGVSDRFAGVACYTAVTGCPLLVGGLTAVDCRLWAVYDGGDHDIFVGEVVAVSLLAGEGGDVPLLYYGRRWQRGVDL